MINPLEDKLDTTEFYFTQTELPRMINPLEGKVGTT